MSSNAVQVLQMRRESRASQPARDLHKERITRYFKKDKAFFMANKEPDRPIKYDFNDPVLNKEFLESVTHKN